MTNIEKDFAFLREELEKIPTTKATSDQKKNIKETLDRLEAAFKQTMQDVEMALPYFAKIVAILKGGFFAAFFNYKRIIENVKEIIRIFAHNTATRAVNKYKELLNRL